MSKVDTVLHIKKQKISLKESETLVSEIKVLPGVISVHFSTSNRNFLQLSYDSNTTNVNKVIMLLDSKGFPSQIDKL